jgi:hypothetical protein
MDGAAGVEYAVAAALACLPYAFTVGGEVSSLAVGAAKIVQGCLDGSGLQLASQPIEAQRSRARLPARLDSLGVGRLDWGQ